MTLVERFAGGRALLSLPLVSVLLVRFDIKNHRQKAIVVAHLCPCSPLFEIVNGAQLRHLSCEGIRDKLVDGNLMDFSQFAYSSVADSDFAWQITCLKSTLME